MNDKITFPRLAAMLADRSGRSKRFSEDFLREFFSLISETLEAGESVKVRGLGTFRLSRVEPRMSVDVTTGQPMEISGHSKVVFVPSKELAEAVNAPFEAFTAIEISDDVDLSQLFPEEAADTEPSTPVAESVISFDNPKGNTPLPSEPSDDLADEPDEEPDYLADEPEAESDDLADEPNTESDDLTDEPATESDDLADESDTESADHAKEPNTETVILAEETPAAPEETAPSTQDRETSGNNPEIPEAEADDLTTDEPRRSRTRIFLISMAAAAVALTGTMTIWYFFFNDGFNRVFYPDRTDAVGANVSQGKDNGAPQAATVPVPTEVPADSVQDSTTEEEVPTAPSDALVYDTISTTRYLTTMAKSHYGNYNLWPYIYEENKAKLGHPDRIRPGTPVVVPDLKKYGVNPSSEADIEKAKKMGMEIYARYGKKI